MAGALAPQGQVSRFAPAAQMVEDPIDDRPLGDDGDDAHLAPERGVRSWRGHHGV
jgi:hypothetical protein